MIPDDVLDRAAQACAAMSDADWKACHRRAVFLAEARRALEAVEYERLRSTRDGLRTFMDELRAFLRLAPEHRIVDAVEALGAERDTLRAWLDAVVAAARRAASDLSGQQRAYDCDSMHRMLSGPAVGARAVLAAVERAATGDDSSEPERGTP